MPLKPTDIHPTPSLLDLRAWSGAVSPLDLDTLARTICGEARGEPYIGQVAIAMVIRNRALRPQRFGKTVREVCLHPKQFSCWNDSDPNKPKLDALSWLDECYVLAFGIACLVLSPSGPLPDYSNGGDHYHTRGVDPVWDDKMVHTATVGHHEFYREMTS